MSIVLGVNRTRLELARACCRAYPFRRGRWRLASLLFAGSPGTWEEVPRIALQEMRGHQLVKCRYGLNVRVREDLTYVDPFVFGDYEPTLTRALRRLVRPGATVFDVGANFGWYACLLARVVGSEGHVHAFEPVPSITALARETIELNKAGGNVTINQMALTSSAGSLIVNTFAGLPHSHASHVDLGRTDASPNVCVSTTIDTYVSDAGIRRVDLIKADVEGHELAVFAGGEGLLTRDDAPILAFELNPACLAHHGTSGTELLALLRRLGYTHVWRLSAKGGPTRLSGNGPATNTTVVACKPGKVGLVRTGIAAA